MPSPITLVTGQDEYWHVDMGPIPDKPEWHRQMYASQSYPFPTVEAATGFAQAHKEKYPGREVLIRFPDGRRWDGKQWVA